MANPTGTILAAQVHRFRDTVAVYFRTPDGAKLTAYMGPELAREIAKAMENCGVNILDCESFMKSNFRAVSWELKES